MTDAPIFSVASLFAERDAARRRELEAEEHLKRRKEEELASFKRRLETFQVTQEHIDMLVQRVRRAFERGDCELMLTAFPSDFCSDDGRSVTNGGRGHINKPAATGSDPEPEWLATLPAGARQVYDYWKSALRPGGFRLDARIISYPGGMPGDVGLFLTWPRSTTEMQS